MKAGSAYNKLNDSYESDEADNATLGHANTQEHLNVDSNRQRIAQDPPPVSEQKIEPNQQHECAPMIDHDFANFEEGFSEQNDGRKNTGTSYVENEDFTSNLAHMHAGSIQFTPSLRTENPDENIHSQNAASAGDSHLPISKDGSSSGSSVTRFFSLTKKPKKVREPKVKASGIINYGINSDSESDVSSISTQSKGYELPYDMSNAMQYSQVRFDDGKDADDNSIRTPIPTKPPEPGLVLPSSFLRDRNVSTVSDLSEEETSVVKRKRREDENVGRLVQAAKQQQSFAQAWFNAGNFLPPRPPKKGMPSNAPVDLKKKKRSGEESSGPIDLDSGDVWDGEDDSDQGEVGSKTNWEIGSFNFTTHSGTTKKRRNKRGKGIPDDEELTAYYQAKCGDRTVCTLGRIRCSLLALIIVAITILLIIGATFAGIYIPRSFEKIIVESAAPSTSPMPTTSPPSISPSLRPSTRPSPAPSSIPSNQPSKLPTTSPSISPTISLQPSSKPSSSPTTYFADETFLPFGTRIQHPLPQIGDEFGYVVKINKEGNIVAIGSDNPSASRISVVLFELLEGGINPEYIQKGNVINGLEAELLSDRLSMDISSDGLSIVIGEYTYNDSKGAVRVFNFNELSSEWERIGDILEVPENFSFSPPFFGSSVSISDDGKTIAVGAPNIDWGDGKVYLYRNDNGVWDLDEEFESMSTAPLVESNFGSAVALSGDGKVLACGAEKGTLNTSVGTVSLYGQGFARVYKYDDFFEAWKTYDIPYTGELDETVVFPLANFGHTISLSEYGSKLVIGAYTDSVNGQENVGSVYVYSFSPVLGTYELESKLSGDRKDTFFGTSTTMSRSGDFLAVGTQNPETNGSVIAYRYSEGGGFWDASVAIEGDDRDYLGQSVALTSEVTVGGDEKVMLIVGSPNKNIESAGSARVFQWNS